MLSQLKNTNHKVGTKFSNKFCLVHNLFIGGSSTLLEKGDLVRLNSDNSGETLMKTRWCIGTNERTKKEADFPMESLYILPTLSKPPTDILVVFIRLF